jgi:hypothetical protein
MVSRVPIILGGYSVKELFYIATDVLRLASKATLTRR